MQQRLYLLSIIFCLFVSSCHDDNEPENISWSRDASALIKKGISLTYEKGEVIMNFTAMSSGISASSDESWIDSSVSQDEGNGELKICIFENWDIEPRQGDVTVHTQGTTTVIHITQQGIPNAVVPENDSYYHNHEKGEITVRVHASSQPVAGIFIPKNGISVNPPDIDWIKINKITAAGENEYIIALTVEKNEGLGRIAALDFKINGSPAFNLKGCKPCIIQEPAPFKEHVEVAADEPGCLQILLGNDADNLSRIRFLKVNGAVNGLDFPVIKSLLSEHENSCEQKPVSIDLSECGIVAGDKNPFEYYGWTPAERYGDIFLYGEIPSNVFTNAVNLKEIVLPEGLRSIGASAFKGCRNLKRVKIPNSVEEINSKAFYNCLGMEEITIGHDSNLSSIGNQAFTTGSLLKDLTIPITAVNISGEAFLGCMVSHLHLKWHEPVEIKIVPKTVETLLVPKGTADVYRNTRNWCNIKNIIEE